MEEDLKRFLVFMKKHQNEDMQYKGENGLLVTRDCSGNFGGCCSESFDLEALLEAVEDLING